MSIQLSKGARQSLPEGLTKVDVGLGWDPIDISNVVKERKGLIGGLISKAETQLAHIEKPNMDIDASCYLIDSNGKCINHVYFNNMSDSSNGIKLSGDDRTGSSSASGEDDETIYIDLPSVKPNVEKIEIWANIYNCESTHQHFGQVNNAFVRLVNRDTKQELCRYDLTDEYSNKTAIHMGTLYKKDGTWKFNAIGEGTYDKSISSIKSKY
jgi:Uncharacterized proteins involved in stress response, homologs of TerZ and putative cAMP-binding protein CABP1